jgi:hypothetical protein
MGGTGSGRTQKIVPVEPAKKKQKTSEFADLLHGQKRGDGDDNDGDGDGDGDGRGS